MRWLLAAFTAAAIALTLAATGAGESPRQLASALAEQRTLTEERPNDAGVWNDLGNLLSLVGDVDEAERAYARALELDPTSSSALFNLALLREERSDLAGAAGGYRSLLELDPGNARAHYQLGSIEERLGQRQEALRRYAEAFTLDPELLFAETNPHIIENRLVTEALLIAGRGRRSQPSTPRAYDEPGRINSLLAPQPPTVAPGQEAAPAEPPPDGATAWSRPRSGLSAAGDPPRGTEDSAADRRRSAEPATGHRVLDSSDLRGGVRNQVKGDAAAPAAPGTRRRAGAAVTTPDGTSRRQSLHQPAASDDVTGFAFGQRSTGSLEWQLGPASDEPVPAR
ncbi:MAG TPA: tetratricopeptide repeat protein [Thermoanaerobaculia bacterium]|nr:tetratricopeptide repeat protein [Thermoanaerobaculia bacterium]